MRKGGAEVRKVERGYLVREVATQLNCSPATVLRRIHDGKLKAVITGRIIRVLPPDLARFIRDGRNSK